MILILLKMRLRLSLLKASWNGGLSARLAGNAGLVSGYFNAGFILINIPLWTAENISKKAIEMLKDPEVVQRITHLDQDVLNIFLVNKARFVDKNLIHNLVLTMN